MRTFTSGVLGFIMGILISSSVVFATSKVIEIEDIPLRYFFNGIEKQLPDDLEGFVYKGRTYLPLRFIAEALNKKVDWNESTSTIHVNDIEQNSTVDEDSNNKRYLYDNSFNRGFVLQKDGWIYFRNYSDGDKLYKMKDAGLNKMKINDDIPKFINVVNDWIYYSNDADDSKLYKAKIDGTERTKLTDDTVESLYCMNDCLYYSGENYSHNKYGLYKINNDGTSKVLIEKVTALDISVINDWIYYNNNYSEICRIRSDGTNKSVIKKDGLFNTVIYDNTIYYSDGYEFEMYKMGIDGTNNLKINCSDQIECFNADNEWIYYQNISDENKLYKIRIDGTGRVKLSDTPAMFINLTDEYIYFMDKSSSLGQIYRIKKDGTGQELVK